MPRNEEESRQTDEVEGGSGGKRNDAKIASVSIDHTAAP
jgi:hypothetical protein